MALQEYFEYDNDGRLWKTNSGGVDTVFLYDVAGNRTAQIQSLNVDLRTDARAATAALAYALPLGLLVGLLIGAFFAYLVAAMGDQYYWEIMLPGSVLGLIVGYATQRYGGHAPAQAGRSSRASI